jgi:hypothetical protein
VADAQNLGNGRHGQAVTVGSADGFIALLPHVFVGLLQGGFTLGVVLGKGRQAGSGFGGLAFGSGDLKIV